MLNAALTKFSRFSKFSRYTLRPVSWQQSHIVLGGANNLNNLAKLMIYEEDRSFICTNEPGFRELIIFISRRKAQRSAQ